LDPRPADFRLQHIHDFTPRKAVVEHPPTGRGAGRGAPGALTGHPPSWDLLRPSCG